MDSFICRFTAVWRLMVDLLPYARRVFDYYIFKIDILLMILVDIHTEYVD